MILNIFFLDKYNKMYTKMLQYGAVLILLVYIYFNNPILMKKDFLMFIFIGMLIFHYGILYFDSENFDNNLSQGSILQQESVSTKTTQNTQSLNSELTDLEIINHIQHIVKNINNHDVLVSIYDEIKKEPVGKKKDDLLAIFELTTINPMLIAKLASTNIKKVLEMSKFLKTIPEIKDLIKINKNDKDISVQSKQNDEIPEFLKKLIEQQKYVDKNGLIRDVIKSDMKYSQLEPSMYQPPVRSEDDEWDTTGYTLLDPSVWRPRIEQKIDKYQENECPVCPSMTNGYPTNLLEYDKSRYVIPKDNISLEYVKRLNDNKKLNLNIY